MWRNSLAGATGLLAVVFCIGAAPAGDGLSRFEAVEPHMGTLFHIELYAANKEQAAVAFEKAFARVHELDQRLSDYNPDSEAMRLCRDSQGKPLVVSRDLFLMLSASQRLSEISGGAFDVTAGRAIQLWRAARKTHQLPKADELKAVRTTNWRDVRLNDNDQTAAVPSGMILDFGAIAKGYAADEALAVLNGLGITSALVAASGDIAMGAPPASDPMGWRVGLDWAESPLRMAHKAISTSGDTEQFVEIDGTRYSHIIDARTGQAVTTTLIVTVIAPRGMDSDPLATTLTILGPDEGMRILNAYPGAEAVFYDRVTRKIVAKTPGFGRN